MPPARLPLQPREPGLLERDVVVVVQVVEAEHAFAAGEQARGHVRGASLPSVSDTLAQYEG